MGVESIVEPMQYGHGERAPDPWWVRAVPRRVVLVLLGLVPLLTPVISPKDDSPFIYPYCMLMQLVGAWFCWQAARRYPTEKIRWRTVALAQCLHAVAYAMSGMEGVKWSSYVERSWLANGCTAACWVLFLPALMGVRSARGKWVRGLDALLTVMTWALLMQAMGSGARPGHGTSRVVVGVLAVTFVTAAAFVARVASTGPAIKLFTSVMSMYLTASLAIVFLLNVVNLYWLPEPNILGSDMLITVPSLLLCEWTMGWQRPLIPRRNEIDPALVESLQPSIMTIGGMLLALYGFRAHSVVAASIVVVLVVCYALRTQLFYQRMFLQQKQLRTQASQMEELATRDSLTGVGNRRWFDEEAGKLLAAGRSYPCSMVLVDADKFKEINDGFGHPMGDEVLRALALALSEVTAQVKRGCCARIGGDEFGALWPGTDAAQALQLAEELRARVEIAEFDAPLSATVSLGVATAQEGLPLMRLMRWADSALYRAKGAGRNTVIGIDLGTLRDDEEGRKLATQP